MDRLARKAARKGLVLPPEVALQVFYGAVTLCAVQFGSSAAYDTFETMASMFTKEEYGWGVDENGWLWTLVGIASVVIIAMLQFASSYSWYSDRVVIGVGSVCQFIGYFVLLPWGVGGAMPLWRFLFGVSVFVVGYTTDHIVCLLLYTKLLYGANKGQMMGYYNNAEALSRTIMPILVAYTAEWWGVRSIFYLASFSMAVVCVVCVSGYAYQRIPPLLAKLNADEDTNLFNL